MCRFCCKSPFALVIKIYFGCTGDFRVKMWGTSSPDDKLTDALGNAIEGTRISGRRWIFLTAEKFAPGDLGLLQQYLPTTDIRDLCTPPSSFRPVRFLIDNVAANHCHQCTDVADSNLFHSQRVGTQHREIGEFAGLKGAFLSFVEA